MTAGPTSSTLLSRSQIGRIPPIFQRELDYRWGTEGCWEWRGANGGKGGYGQVAFIDALSARPRSTGAHRLAYLLFRGDIAPGLTLDHLCCNPLCWRPDHLEPVTMRVNALRGDTVQARNASKTVCPKGHPLTPENNLHWAGLKGYRGCLTCHRDRSREQSAVLRAAAKALGMTKPNYVRIFGYSAQKAQSVVDAMGASR